MLNNFRRVLIMMMMKERRKRKRIQIISRIQIKRMKLMKKILYVSLKLCSSKLCIIFIIFGLVSLCRIWVNGVTFEN